MSADLPSGMHYGPVARGLHRLAFSSLKLQTALAEIEDRLFRIPANPPPSDRPVFITSLPRAGTTLLLEMLYRSGEFTSHTYRNMPFVLSPLLWQHLSSAFRRQASLSERAHGDGMRVGFDSPEAFEEILWMAFYAPRYQLPSLPVWTEKAHKPSFERFFKRHIHKLHSLENRRAPAPRYLSKNNANIARLALLPRLFPDCRIVVPFRQPALHIKSLHDQHQRFLRLHRQDRFGRDYMRWIGHFDFGAALKPLNFDQWRDRADASDTASTAFWRAYWLAAFRHILHHAASCPNIILLDLETARLEPERSLRALATRLELQEPDNLLKQSREIRASSGVGDCRDEDLSSLFGELQSAALNGLNA